MIKNQPSRWRFSLRTGMVAMVTVVMVYILVESYVNRVMLTPPVGLASRVDGETMSLFDQEGSLSNSTGRGGNKSSAAVQASSPRSEANYQQVLHPYLDYYTDEKNFRKSEPSDVLLFAAVIGNSSARAVWDRVVVTGWKHKKYRNTSLHCCVRYNYSLIQFPAVNHDMGDGRLRITRFICQNIPTRHTWGPPISVSLAADFCPENADWFFKPIFAHRPPNNAIAICAKVAYKALDAWSIVEWFEIQRWMKVDKVLLFTYKLNDAATRVINYYKEQGFVETYPYDYPSKGRKHAEIGNKNLDAFNDERVVQQTCMEILRGYKYVALLDLDEFLIPLGGRNWKELLALQSQRHPTAAGFSFQTQLYVTSWGETDQLGDFRVTRYLNRTMPLVDRVKYIMTPERIVPEGSRAHGFTPAKGFLKVWCLSSEAVVKHYRKCRDTWYPPYCLHELERYHDDTMVTVMKRIADKTLQIRDMLLN